MRNNVTVFINHLYEVEHIERLRNDFPHTKFIHLPKAPPWPEEIAEGSVLLFAGLKKPELSKLLQRASKVDWIHTGSAGFDWVAVPEVSSRNITVSRSADVMSIPMAEFAMGAILSYAKHLPRLFDAQRRHAWEPPMHKELHGKTLLIIGAGSIGSRVGGLGLAFGMRVVGVKRDGKPLPTMHEVHKPDAIERLLPEADYVVLATPATPETRGMINARRLGLMQPHAYLVNVGRGALIVEEDLIAALKAGTIAGACLDAFTTEPLPPTHPLWDMPNVFISPHASYRTPEIRVRVFQEFAYNLKRYLAHEPVANTMRHPALGY